MLHHALQAQQRGGKVAAVEIVLDARTQPRGYIRHARSGTAQVSQFERSGGHRGVAALLRGLYLQRARHPVGGCQLRLPLCYVCRQCFASTQHLQQTRQFERNTHVIREYQRRASFRPQS